MRLLLKGISVGVLALSVVGCGTNSVKTGQALGLSYSVKTKKACPQLTEAAEKITQYVDTVQCYKKTSDKFSDHIAVSKDFEELTPLLSELSLFKTNIDPVAAEFCALREKGVKKVKDDEPLFDRYFSLLQRLEDFKEKGGLFDRVRDASSSVNENIQATAKELHQKDSDKASEIIGEYARCKL